MLNMKRRRVTPWVLVATVLAVAGFAASVSKSANATTQRVNDACPVPFATGYSCEYQPANKSSSSHSHVVTKTTLTEKVRNYEHVHHVRVTVDHIPGGLKSTAGCIDPVARGFIHDGGMFSNTGGITVYRFDDKWHAGTLFCNYHRIFWKGQWWLEGTKGNCGNPNVRIPLFSYKVTKLVPVVRFTSVKTLIRTVDRTATATSKTKYWCETGWTLTYVNGKAWCFKATQIPTTPTTTTTTTTTTSPPPPPPPPPSQSVTITSMTTLNDIPEGKTSGPFNIYVNASAAGSITIDPGVGGVSDCNSSTKQDSISFNIGAGNSSVCVIFYAPTDKGTNSMTITATAIVGNAKDVKSHTFAISHPTRP